MLLTDSHIGRSAPVAVAPCAPSSAVTPSSTRRGAFRGAAGRAARCGWRSCAAGSAARTCTRATACDAWADMAAQDRLRRASARSGRGASSSGTSSAARSPSTARAAGGALADRDARRRAAAACATARDVDARRPVVARARRLRRAGRRPGVDDDGRCPTGWRRDVAALTEPMAVAWHAVRRGEVGRRTWRSSIGCGPVGLGVILCLKARGVGTVVASDFSAGRRALATALRRRRRRRPARRLALRGRRAPRPPDATRRTRSSWRSARARSSSGCRSAGGTSGAWASGSARCPSAR